MDDSLLWSSVAHRIGVATGVPFSLEGRRSVGGGCISAAYVLAGGTRRYFVKINDASRLPMFEAEAGGLEEIVRSGAVRAPRPVCFGASAGVAFLVLEYLELRSCSGACQAALGRQLAQMHRCFGPCYGWHRDNAIGATPQLNAPAGDWPSFWRERRLGPQLALARENGAPASLVRKGERLLHGLPAFFPGYAPSASLLHGDLWGGNAAMDDQGNPVIFDPAVYFGDREADIAMTELFGGFTAEFYAVYRESFALDAGYAVRRTLYNLYHILNHFNLFGGGYAYQAERMVDALLSEAG